MNKISRTLLGLLTLAAVSLTSKSYAAIQLVTPDTGPNLVIKIVQVIPAPRYDFQPKDEVPLKGYTANTSSNAGQARVTYTPGERHQLYHDGEYPNWDDFHLNVFNSHGQVVRSLVFVGNAGSTLWKLFNAISDACPLTLEISKASGRLEKVTYPCDIEE